jgi:hypothetical protein
MKMLLSLIVILCLAGLLLVWDGQRQAVAGVRADCESTGVERAICTCTARKFKERAGLMTFVGFGDTRPLMISRAEKNEALAKAGVLCLAERVLN